MQRGRRPASQPRQQPTEYPQEGPKVFSVVPLTAEVAPRGAGRPKKLKMPPLPAGIWDGMAELEQQHYDYFVGAFRAEYPTLSAADLLCLQQAAIEYINLLRVQAQQLSTGQVISMARQHPGVQLRQWLDMLSVTRKQRRNPDTEGSRVEADLKETLMRLSQPA
jgi:hypothetical protein